MQIDRIDCSLCRERWQEGEIIVRSVELGTCHEGCFHAVKEAEEILQESR